MALNKCVGTTDEQGRELLEHGTVLFPVACYHDDLQTDEVPWHWHEEMETALVEVGDVTV